MEGFPDRRLNLLVFDLLLLLLALFLMDFINHLLNLQFIGFIPKIWSYPLLIRIFFLLFFRFFYYKLLLFSITTVPIHRVLWQLHPFVFVHYISLTIMLIFYLFLSFFSQMNHQKNIHQAIYKNLLFDFFNFILDIVLLNHIVFYPVQITFFLRQKVNWNFKYFYLMFFGLNHPINGLKLIETVCRQKMFKLDHLRFF